MHHTVLPALADPLFQLQIAPEAAFPHPAWQQARAAALRALDSGGIAVLLGPPGSGKSLLLKDLARTLRRAGRPARLIERTEALDGPPGSGILLVDEADTLGADALLALCSGPAPVVFAALPGFPERLAACRRPVVQTELDHLQPQDVARYVAARLDAMGRPRGLLEPEAVLALARHSGGLLRLVNTLGGAAVFLASLDGSAHVSRRHVDEAAAMRDDFCEDMPPPFGTEPIPDAPIPAEPVLAELPPAPPVLSEPPPLAPAPAPTDPGPLPALPNYRAETLRRRTALGTMMAAAGVLFALPWLTRGQSGAQPAPAQAAGGDQAAPSAQPGAGAPSLAVADASGTAPDAAPDAAPGTSVPQAAPQTAPPAPESSPQLMAAASSPPRAEPVRRADKGAPAAPMAGESRVAAIPDDPVLFQGPIYNETMGQGGHVVLVIRKQAPAGAITARFDASQGLVGSGMLAGSVSGAGRITASGQLLMGKNPFNCDLSGTIVGDKLTGSASFVRNGSRGWAARSVFTLTRA